VHLHRGAGRQRLIDVCKNIFAISREWNKVWEIISTIIRSNGRERQIFARTSNPDGMNFALLYKEIKPTLRRSAWHIGMQRQKFGNRQISK
jgi:hypothetical protein